MNVRSSLLVIVPGALLAATAVCALTEWQASQRPTGGAVVTPEQAAAIRDAPDDISFKKVKGKFKYKSDDPSDAQQKWVVAGEVPTAYTSFDQVSSVGCNAQNQAGDVSTSNMRSVNPTGILGRKRNRYREKFFYFAARSEHHDYPTYGKLKMKIKDGMLQYMYVISKANEGGQLVGMNKYGDVKAATATGKVERTMSASGGFTIGGEAHAGTRTVTTKAKSKQARFKLTD
jgi:hypothetical protein